MDYQGPTADDLDNIRALNRCFLKAFCGSGVAGPGVLGDRRLSAVQLSRLSAAPFLLFSFREHEHDFWLHVLSDELQLDLTSQGTPLDVRVHDLQVAALGFLWQLSHRNPYAARVVSGAPVSWCEQLAGQTLMRLLHCAAHRADLLVPRFEGQDRLWRRLLHSGVSAKRQLVLMSHQSALQSMLTRSKPLAFERLPAAACSITPPQQRIAERQQAPGADAEV